VLAAVAELHPAAVEATLPLTVRASTHVDGRSLAAGEQRTGRLQFRLVLRNQTAVTVRAFTAERVSRLDAAKALDGLRQAVALRQPLPEPAVRVAGARVSTVVASASLRISGSIVFNAESLRATHVSGANVSTRGGRSTVRFHRVLGGGRPFSLSLAVGADAVRVRPPSIRLVAEPVLDEPRLSPPGRSWTKAVRERRRRLDGRALLSRAIVLGLRYGRARQFETFLATPDPFSPSRATYLFRSAARAPAAGAPRRGNGGSGMPLVVVIALGAVPLAVGLLVLWAHM
jgi:hypothetical protein